MQLFQRNAAETIDPVLYDEAFQQLRAHLVVQYQTRIRTKTAERLPINLRAKPTPFGTSPNRIRDYFEKLTIESADIAPQIGRILETHKRLLVVGDPGSGKTTILLFAALHILNDPGSLKLPLLLNLATWSAGLDFGSWYAQNLAQSYNLSPVFTEALIQRNAIVPFFDGFDEVQADFRADCLGRMGVFFRDDRNRQLIVSSRKVEYGGVEADAPVYTEIEIQPLEIDQIKKALSENAQGQAADQALLHALDEDEWLSQAVETPFYLNTASFLFGQGEKTLADFHFNARSAEGRQAELVEQFVAQQVPEVADRRYLTFLAGKMREDRFLVFELIRMQPGWCGSVWWYNLALGLMLGFFGGLFAGSIMGSSGYFINGKVINIYSVTLFGFILASLVGMYGPAQIRTEDIQIWRWQLVKKQWRAGVREALNFGLLLFVACLIFMSIFIGFFYKLFIFITMITLVIMVIFGLKEAGTAVSYLLHIPKPYQRFESTFYIHLKEIPFLGVCLMALAYARTMYIQNWSHETILEFMSTDKFWLMTLAATVMLLMLPLIFSHFLEHFALRFVLWREGKIPFRYVRFLDRMSDQLIFEDNRQFKKRPDGRLVKMRGATWRFRHKILQDYFAEAAPRSRTSGARTPKNKSSK